MSSNGVHISQHEKKHVVFVARGLHDVGGIERVTLVVANMLSEAGYRVSILCLQKEEPFYKVPDSIGLFYLDDAEGKTRSERLLSWIDLNHPMLLVVVGTNRPLFILKAREKCPVVAWEHLNASISAHPLHNLYRSFYSRHAKIVTLSVADEEAWKHKFPRADVFCIPNPVTLPKAAPSRLTNKRVLAVGRLAGQKGFDLLLKAWAQVEGRYPEWTLRIVGSGRWEKILRKLVIKLRIASRVEMIPATTNIVSEYQNASIYALSSRYEGFGLVLVEAMQMGLPVVSFDCPQGPREIVSQGETGLLVPNGNVLAFADALSEMISNQPMREKMSKQALLHVERFSEKSTLAKWVTLIESCTSNL